jgi:SHAQKYF class myb-like DNA-binding protein
VRKNPSRVDEIFGSEEIFILLEDRASFAVRETKSSKASEDSEEADPVKRSKLYRWSQTDHSKFIQAVKDNGKNWKAITAQLKPRTRVQIASYTQRLRNDVKKDPSRMEALLGQDVFDILEGPLVTGKP